LKVRNRAVLAGLLMVSLFPLAGVAPAQAATASCHVKNVSKITYNSTQHRFSVTFTPYSPNCGVHVKLNANGAQDSPCWGFYGFDGTDAVYRGWEPGWWAGPSASGSYLQYCGDSGNDRISTGGGGSW
jgi:hypothetical protein